MENMNEELEKTQSQAQGGEIGDFENILNSIDKKSKELKYIEKIKKENKELHTLLEKVKAKKERIIKLKEEANIWEAKY